jgi:hypothetical protein
MKPDPLDGDYPTPQYVCPHCGYLTDCATSLKQPGKQRAPETGDLLVCLNCAEPARVECFGLAKLTPYDLSTVYTDPEFVALLTRTKAAIKQVTGRLDLRKRPRPHHRR